MSAEQSDPVSFQKAKWDKARHPDELRPRDALLAALEETEGDDLKHIVVCVAAKTEDNAARYRFFQAGAYDAAGQVGLLRLIQDQILGVMYDA